MKLTFDELLSNVGFNCNLRHYNLVTAQLLDTNAGAPHTMAAAAPQQPVMSVGGRAFHSLALHYLFV